MSSAAYYRQQESHGWANEVFFLPTGVGGGLAGTVGRDGGGLAGTTGGDGGGLAWVPADMRSMRSAHEAQNLVEVPLEGSFSFLPLCRAH